MKKAVYTYLRTFLCSAVLILMSVNAKASHIVGVDLYYTWVSGSTYQITLVAYGDCGSAALSTAFGTLYESVPQICIFDGDSYQTSINLTIQPPVDGVEITPVCPADINLTQCTNTGYTIPGIKKFVYTGTYTVPHTSAVWRFLYLGYMGTLGAGAGRAAAITNIASGSVIQLVDTLNNTVGHNSNPVLEVIPTPFFCLNNNDNYNPGAVDPDLDSLSFFLVSGMSSTLSTSSDCEPGSPVSYVSPYTAAAPLAVTSFSFDPATGQISFFPNALQRSLVVYNVEEHRGGVLVGTSQREMTFLVLTCTNTAPSGGLASATAGVIDDSIHFHICQNTGPFSVQINPTEADAANNITVTATGLPAGCTFSTTGNGTPTPHCTISWTSTGVTPGSYTFYVTYSDNNCPLAGTQTLAYTISILPVPGISAAIISPATCLKKAAVSVVPSGSGGPWKIKVSDAGDTIQTYPAVFANFTDSLVPGNYVFSIFTSASASCNSWASLSIVAPAVPTPTVTVTNPSYCGNNDGTIKLQGLIAGNIDTISFYLNGLLQPSQVHTVAADGTITLAGLSAGTYSNISATYGNCIATAVGPFFLTTPPFTMRALGSVNPSYCGYCNGTITIYGLHPGQLDTINYTFNGTVQPAVTHLIGTDSMVTLTGLCQGTYANFIANTDGICVSNTLGPVTLTVPPFTMRALSSVNPSYCGICNGTITLYGLHPGEPDTITYTYNGVPQPGVSFTIPADSTVTLTGLCEGTYTNFIAKTDGVCVSNTLGPVILTVPPFTMRAVTSTNPDYCGVCNGTITLYGLHPGELDTITYTYNGVAQPGLSFTIPADSTVHLTGLCQGLYTNFVAKTGGICVSNSLGPVTLGVPPFTMRALSYTNPDYCGICNGTITLYGLHPGELDTITYSYNGVTQPGISVTIPVDSTVHLTGLCEGTYANFIARTGGVCVSNTLGPVVLSVPPFTMRALSYTNPDYCGICNGTITLYGLHPGELDTITYTYNGVAQPGLSFTIGADSTVALTGLCAGSYTNFVARTGGICISNSLGPVNLTVPPFTIRSQTYINPTECGFCNGSVTIYGIHPGETDTLNYTFNGTAQPAYSYTIPADSSITVPGLCEGVYSNFVLSTGGDCVSNALGPDTLKAPPIVPGFTYTIHEGCGGDTLTCTNTSTPATQLTYTWDFGDGGSDTATNPVHIYYSPGTFTIRLTITNTRCVADTTQSVTLNNLINAGFTDVPDSFVCKGKVVTFTNASTGTLLNYNWYYGDGGTDTTTNAAHIYSYTGTYHVMLIVTNYVPCHDTVIKNMEVDSISAISMLATDTVICRGGAVTFTGIYTSIGNTGVIWSFGDGTSVWDVNPVTHAFETAGMQTVTVEATYRACPDTSVSQDVHIFAYPGINLGPDTSICPGGTPITLTDEAADKDAIWLWNTGQTTPAISVSEPGYYYATVSINGCSSSDTVWVQNDCYMDIPNAFTPDGDGVNDYFYPREYLTRGLIFFELHIYNRWGQVVFETSNTEGRGWDGKFNSVPQPQGVYIYQIDATFKDGQKEHKQGNVTLLR